MPDTYLDRLNKLVGEEVRLLRFEVDSFMNKDYQEGRFSIFTRAPKPESITNQPLYQLRSSEYRPWSAGLERAPEFIGTFSLVAMPGCCGVVVSTGSFINEIYRGRGLGNVLNAMRRQMAHEYGYGLMLCTDLIDNLPQQRILARNAWTRIAQFVNPRTDHTVSLHHVHLAHTGIELGFDVYRDL